MHTGSCTGSSIHALSRAWPVYLSAPWICSWHVMPSGSIIKLRLQPTCEPMHFVTPQSAHTQPIKAIPVHLLFIILGGQIWVQNCEKAERVIWCLLTLHEWSFSPPQVMFTSDTCQWILRVLYWCVHVDNHIIHILTSRLLMKFRTWVRLNDTSTSPPETVISCYFFSQFLTWFLNPGTGTWRCLAWRVGTMARPRIWQLLLLQWCNRRN